MFKVNKKQIGLVVALNIFILCAPAQRYAATDIRCWHFNDALAIADTQVVDTSFVNYPLKDVLNNYSIAYTFDGNLVSPVQAKIYFDRTDKMDFLFGKSYEPYIATYQDVKYFYTNTPFSTIAYKKGFTTYHEDNDLDFSFAGNVTRRTNLGLTLNYLNATGRYKDQAGKRFAGTFFGSYKGDKYSCNGSFAISTLSNYESGGLQNPEDLSGKLNSYDLPVNLNGSGGMSGFRYIDAFWNHHYSICIERERKETIKPKQGSEEQERDTIIIEYIPVTTFMHTFQVKEGVKRYVEKQSQMNFFDTAYYHSSYTNDTAAHLTISNTLAVTFEEEFNKWLHFGATVYATNEFVRYGFIVPDYMKISENTFGNNFEKMSDGLHQHTDSLVGYRWTNNTFVGGALYKNTGKWIKYGFQGEVCLAGYKLGEFNVDGHIDGSFPLKKSNLELFAKAYIKNETPDYFLQHFRSNHFRWDNDFQKTYRFYVGGDLSYKYKFIKTGVNVGFENLTRYIYFSADGLPMQHSGNIQVLSVNGKLDIFTKRFGMENNVVWQLSSSSLLPLPDISLYHNIYYHDTWFRALDVQIGVDMRYNTAYYAPLLNPATGQFCLQQVERVGNHPILSAYANFYVRLLRLKIFAHFYHFNEYFMKNNYFSMPGYATNPPFFRAGLAWHFYK